MVFVEGRAAMRHRIGLATACLHISAVLYVIIGFGMLLLTKVYKDEGLGLGAAIAMLVFCLVLAIGIEIVAYWLHQRKFWAWIAGLCIFGMYATSIFLPLGALGLWGLLAEGSRAEFGVGNSSRDRDRL
jgi:hypothetical protein